MPKNGEYFRFKNYERNIKSTFMTYAGFESILVPEDNGKQNLDEKTCCLQLWLSTICADDKSSKPFKSYLVEDAVYNFITNMVEENKYCTDVMQKNFNKELIMANKDNENFKSCTKCLICENVYVDGDFKVKDN